MNLILDIETLWKPTKIDGNNEISVNVSLTDTGLNNCTQRRPSGPALIRTGNLSITSQARNWLRHRAALETIDTDE